MVRYVKDLEDFKQEISYSGVTIAYFTAEWCGGCQMVTPIIDASSKIYENLHFIKVDGKENQDVFKDCNIAGMPSIFFYRNGQHFKSVLGKDEGFVKTLKDTIKELGV